MKNEKKRRRLRPEEVVCNPVDKKVLSEMMGMIGDKWSLRVVGALAAIDTSRARFSELERKVEGVSQRMLSTTLRRLERDGIVIREVYPEVPPRVEYELTEIGHSLTVPIKELVDWILEHAGEMFSAREKFDMVSSAKTEKL